MNCLHCNKERVKEDLADPCENCQSSEYAGLYLYQYERVELKFALKILAYISVILLFLDFVLILLMEYYYLGVTP